MSIREPVIGASGLPPASRKLFFAISIALFTGSACSSKEAAEPAVSTKSDTLAGRGAAAASDDRTYSVALSRSLGGGPSARMKSALIFDQVSGRSILFGGFPSGAQAPVNETWAYDGSWSSCPGSSCTTRPRGRMEFGFAHAPDLNGGVGILFGGWAGGSVFCDTWEWNGASGSWTQRSAPAACTQGPGVSSARFGHAMAGFANRVALFGGFVLDGVNSPPTAELLVWDGSSWSELCDVDCAQRSGSVPRARGDATLTHVVTPSKNALFLFGGRSSGTSYLSDLWEFDLVGKSWAQRCMPPCVAQNARAEHGAAFDPVRKKLFVHGGCSANPCRDALPPMEYDPELDSWSSIPSLIATTASDDKRWFGIAYDAKRRRIVEFGGTSTNGQHLDHTVEYYTRGSTCASDAECHTGACVKRASADATGICAEPCASGTPNEGAGPCVDGFRCNVACDQPCETCSAVPGICTLSSGGPDDHCSGNNTCSTQGACLARNGQPCSQGSLCASGICATYGEPVCSEPGCGTQPCVKARADGSCVVAKRGESFDCGGNLTCGDNGQCLTSCERDGDCAPGYFCDPNKQCSIGRRFGEACTRNEECGRGNCSYGVCCAADCRNPCEKCGADGQCEFLKPEDPPRLPCGTGDCAGRCSGTSGLCDFPNSTKLCERADCPEGNCKTHCLEHAWLVEWSCNGSGECVEGRPRACDNDFSCSGGKCSVECSSDEQCRRAATCDVTAQECTPEGERCTDDGFQVKLKNGTIVDCKGYQCIGQGQCSEVCEDQTQCAEGYRCQRHRCEPIDRGRDAGSDAPSGVGDAGVAPGELRDAATEQPDPTKQPQPADDGCATAPGPHDWRASALIAAGLAWLYGRRQKRRHDRAA